MLSAGESNRVSGAGVSSLYAMFSGTIATRILYAAAFP